MAKTSKLIPILFFVVFFGFLFGPLFTQNLVAAPMDTLVGAYFPWLTYQWGYPVGVPVKNALISDVFNSFFNWKHLGMSLFFQGLVPSWNPYEFLGSPLLATFHSALLHPFNIVFLLPVPWGWNLFIATSTLVAAASMYLFLRSYQLPAGSKLFGSVVFALGGPMTTWSEFGTAVWSMAMLPLLFLFVRTGKFLYIPPAVLGLVLAGNVQTLTYSLSLIILFSLVSLKLRQTLLVCLLVGLGLALSAIQLLPTAALYGVSIRADEKYSSYFNFGLQPVSQLIRLIAPDIYGHPVTGNYHNPFSYHEYTGYFTPIALVLGLAAIATAFTPRRFPHQRFFAWISLGSVFLSIDSPVTRFLFSRELPLLTYSSASRVFFVMVFAMSFLSAQYLSRTKINRRLLSTMAICALCFLVVAILTSGPDKVGIAVRNSLLPAGSLLLLLVSIYLPRQFSIWLLLTIVSLDLFRYYTKYNPFVPARLVYPDTQAIKHLQSHPNFAVVSISENTLPENTWVWYGLRSFEGYNPLHLESFNRFAQVANSRKYFNSPSRYVKIQTPNFNLLRLANVGLYVISAEQQLDYKIRSFPQLYAGEGLEIYQDPLAKPPRYVLPKSQIVSSEADLAAALEDPDFDFQTALIYTPIPPDSYLGIFAQAYSPGWQARANGQNLTVIPVFGALTGVITPTTTSLDEINLYYLPPGLIAGSLISLAGILVYIGFCAYRFKHRAKSYIISPA